MFVGMFPGEIECLADGWTTHTILRHRQLFIELIPYYSTVTTMTGSSQLIKGRGIAQFLLPNGTVLKVNEALYAPRANRTLLSFKDIRANGYHLETHCENGNKYLCITSNDCGRKRILEQLMCRSSGLYLTTIRIIESNNICKDNLLDSDTYRLWHDRLGHPGLDMMICILKTSHGHPFYRANRSTNRKMIKGGETDVTDVPKKSAQLIKRPATGRGILGDRSTVSRTSYKGIRRPVDKILDRSTSNRGVRRPVDNTLDRSTKYRGLQRSVGKSGDHSFPLYEL